MNRRRTSVRLQRRHALLRWCRSRFPRARPRRPPSLPGPDLARAAFASAVPPTEKMILRLWSEGIESGAIVRTASGKPNSVQAARVVAGPLRFTFDRARADPNGETSFVFLALDSFGKPVDVVAWRPGEDGFLVSHFGEAAILGGEMIGAPGLGCPLRVYPDVLAWLRDSRRGVVIVDPIGAASVLREVGSLIAEDWRHANDLRALLTIPTPRIGVAAAPPVADMVPDRVEAWAA